MRELYQVVEVGPAWYQENIPCQEACPVKTNCRGYLNLAAAGEFEKGWELALDPNPMASICGSVCAAPCETACRRKEVDKPLSIRYVKKFLSDWSHQNLEVDGRPYTQPPPPVFGPPRGKVAIVGAGCAGLSAASDLAKLGFGVTVFDALDQAGGTTLAGVPPFRLPREVIDRDIAGIVNENVELRLSTYVGRDVTLRELHDENDAVLIGAGCFEPNYPRLPGEDSAGVMAGIVFLERAYRGRPLEVGKSVVVLGGGYTAMDCASTSWRLGADHVYIVYRRSRDEMVVDEEELTETEREGMEFVYLASPVEILADPDGHVRGVVFVRNKLGEPDKSGRRAPEPIAGSEFEIPCESVLLALGQAPDTTWLAQDFPEFRVKRWSEIKVDKETYQTVVPKIFIGGDYRTGPTTIIEAVADGRSAAQQVARFLDENAIAVNVPEYHEVVTLRRSSTPDNVGLISLEGELARVYHNMSVDYDRIPRQEMPKLGKHDRRGLFLEVNQGYTEAQAVAESDRCLKCNFNIEIIGELCIICGGCVDVCPMDVIHMVDMSDIVDDGSIPAVGQAKKWENGVAFYLDETACIRCALCIIRCPTDAITMNRYGTVMPAVGNVLPKESIDDEIHLDLTVAAKKAVRPLPQYDPHLAPGYKDLRNGHKNGAFKHAHSPAVEDKELVKH
ncbi:MAG TPA: FAD-dependent oxidoreductase [Candidatus Limnocylindria bacterium]|jgi:NADPH-dependent glutamate synthase beta subunit-like oxidoreductase|nr:FAD-dependent oxidoreductase [Candidatus Limnocylindria bacterium]